MIGSKRRKARRMTELQSRIYMAIGEASMCWEPTPMGVFDSDHAKRVADDLFKLIDRESPDV